MTTIITRLYSNKAAAQTVVNALVSKGHHPSTIDIISGDSGGTAAQRMRNARVGAAKAAFFPSISLTGLYGGVSGDFSNLLDSNAEVWSVNPSVFAPIFQGGRLRSNYEASQAVYQQAFAQYGLPYVHEVYLPEKLANVKKFLP